MASMFSTWSHIRSTLASARKAERQESGWPGYSHYVGVS